MNTNKGLASIVSITFTFIKVAHAITENLTSIVPYDSPEFLCRNAKFYNFCLFTYSKNFPIFQGVILSALLLLIIGIIGLIVKLFRKKLQNQNTRQFNVQGINRKGLATGILNLLFTLIIWKIGSFLADFSEGFLFLLSPLWHLWLSYYPIRISPLLIFVLFSILASILEIIFSGLSYLVWKNLCKYLKIKEIEKNDT